PPDREIARRPIVSEREASSALESARQGAGQLVEDLRVTIRPWEFDPSEISVPLFVWQGDRDASIPAAWGAWWRRRVAGAELTLCEGEGHLLIEDRIDEVLDALAGVEAPVG